MNAIIATFNADPNVSTLEKYLEECYRSGQTGDKPENIVVIQICCAHFLRIAYKDIESSFTEEGPINFFKYQMIKAVNISSFEIFFSWLNNMFIILLTPNMTKEVETALSKIKSSHSLLEGIGSNSNIGEKTEIDIDNLAEKCLFKKVHIMNEHWGCMN